MLPHEGHTVKPICLGVAVDVGSIDRSFAAASMPGTPCATHSTWLPQMLPGANVERSLTKKPRSHSHRSITVRVSVNCVVRVQFCSELCCCVIVEPIPTLRNKKSMLTVNCEFVLQCVAVDVGSIDRSFAAASMPGTACATHSTSYVKEYISVFLSSVFVRIILLFGRLLFSRLPQMLPGANVQGSLTKKPRSHSHRSITVRVSVNCVVRVQFCSELCCCVIVEPIPTLRNKKSMLTKEETNSVRTAQRNLLYPYLQENRCTGVAVDVGSIDRCFAAASMPGTLCATHSTWLPQMLPGANVQRSLTKKPRSHSHRSIPVRVIVDALTQAVLTAPLQQHPCQERFAQPEYKKEETNSVRAAQRNLLYPYLQENGSTGVAVDAGSIDRSFAAASMPGTLFATQTTRLLKMFPGANVKRSPTKDPFTHSHRSIPVRYKRIVYGLLRDICFTLIYRKWLHRIREFSKWFLVRVKLLVLKVEQAKRKSLMSFALSRSENLYTDCCNCSATTNRANRLMLGEES
ncbi:hypothetical protein M514_20482 [Trichuris suis]|uniref:Uncharacterized protein n=1 Tax=Trichuris suis TaxID=68888 RepID=A0A085NDA0_9BILA|nr:hypothetical protein M514_20482 [Trichuris suis]